MSLHQIWLLRYKNYSVGRAEHQHESTGVKAASRVLIKLTSGDEKYFNVCGQLKENLHLSITEKGKSNPHPFKHEIRVLVS